MTNETQGLVGVFSLLPTVDADKLAEATQAYGVGSILSSPGTAVPIEVWHRLIAEIQDAALATPREIPIIYGLDSIHGAGCAA